MNNRIASIIFTRQSFKINGLKACNLEDLAAELPEGTTVVGFGEDICRNIMQINISNPRFKEVNVGSIIPEVVATFTVDDEGNEDCEIDFSNVLEDGYEVQCNEDNNWKIQIVPRSNVIIHDECSEDTHKPYPSVTTFTAPKDGTFVVCSTPIGKSWLHDHVKEYSDRVDKVLQNAMDFDQDQLGITASSNRSKSKMGHPTTLTLPEGYSLTGSGYNNPLWDYNGEDFGDYDSSKSEEKKSCDHEWKRVQGVRGYYVICEHCEERNKEEEAKQWEDK